MLYRQNFHAVGRNSGGQPRVCHCSRGDRDFYWMAQIDAPENHPSVRGSRTQTQLYPLAAVETNANGTGECLQGSLFEHACDFNRLVFAKKLGFRSYPCHLKTWRQLWQLLVYGHVFAKRWGH